MPSEYKPFGEHTTSGEQNAAADYAALAMRNQALAARIHARTWRQRARGLLLRLVARLPIRPAAGDGRTILLIRPDHVGDVLLTGPAIQALAQARPDARLVALVGPWSAGVVSAYDAIDLTLTLRFPGFARQPGRPGPGPYWQAAQTARLIRQLHAEAAIIFRPDHWWGALAAKLAGVPVRVGFALPDVAPFLTDAQPFQAGHAVQHNLALVRRWTGPANGTVTPDHYPIRYPVEEADQAFIADKLAAQNFPPGGARVIIHPGSGTAIKQWAAAHWAQVADQLAATWGAPILFTGGEHEGRLIAAIIAQMTAPALNLAGETTVGQLAALYTGGRVVLGPDSGPLHLAAAVGTPTVTLFGPADPAEFGPWGSAGRHAVLTTPIACRPCRVLDWPHDDPAYHPCVRDITPEAVIAAARHVATST